MTEWYDFSNVKYSKMLSFDSVAEAYWPDLPSPIGRKFQFCEHTFTDDGRSISQNVAKKHYG